MTLGKFYSEFLCSEDLREYKNCQFWLGNTTGVLKLLWSAHVKLAIMFEIRRSTVRFLPVPVLRSCSRSFYFPVLWLRRAVIFVSSSFSEVIRHQGIWQRVESFSSSFLLVNWDKPLNLKVLHRAISLIYMCRWFFLTNYVWTW